MDLQQKRIILCMVLVIIGTVFLAQTMQPNQPEAIVVQNNTAEKPEDSFSQPEITKNELVVHVAGAVQNPGVYTLQDGSRVEDAITRAQLLPQSDADALNRAALLSDGQKIVVPFAGEAQTSNLLTESETGTMPNDKVNLNHATLAQLMTLPGIGEVKAQAIMQHRQEHNGFQTIDQLLQVNGIGSAIYSQIAHLVCV
jgi:competence protein ComEA